MYGAKLTGILTVLILLPLTLFGLVCILVVHALDFVGQIFLWPGHKITQWLHHFQQEQIREAHAIIPVEEIQKRRGDKDEDI